MTSLATAPPVTWMLLGLLGGLGAAARFAVDGLVRHRVPGWTDRFGATFVVNVTGSLLVGLLVGAQLHLGLGGHLMLLAATGFCGGYTTFSTAMVETVRLHQDGDHGRGVLNLLGTLVACVAAAGLGVLLMWLASGPPP